LRVRDRHLVLIGRAANTSRGPADRTSSIRRNSTTSRRTAPAFSAFSRTAINNPISDKLSPAERASDTRSHTHKLNFELDTACAPFSRLREDSWLRDVEIEGSLDYVATGLPSDALRWSFSLVFVIPLVKGR
jgi:hypothetical protein